MAETFLFTSESVGEGHPGAYLSPPRSVRERERALRPAHVLVG